MKPLRPIIVYVIIAYFISWLFFILLALNHHGIIFLYPDDTAHARTEDLWHSFGGLGPLIGGIITLKLFYRKQDWRQFIGGYSMKKINGWGWIFSLLPLIIFIIALIINRLFNKEWFDIPGYFRENNLLDPFNWMVWFLPILFYGFGEEGGWRGYVLPALQAKYSPLKATAIITVIWVCWHIPSFFYRYHLNGLAYAGLILGIYSGALFLTYLFNYTRGSILAVSIWHFSFNMVSMIAKDSEIISAAMSSIIMMMGILVIVYYLRQKLSLVEKTSYSEHGLSTGFKGQPGG